jgi:hypothetical protein
VAVVGEDSELTSDNVLHDDTMGDLGDPNLMGHLTDASNDGMKHKRNLAYLHSHLSKKRIYFDNLSHRIFINTRRKA